MSVDAEEGVGGKTPSQVLARRRAGVHHMPRSSNDEFALFRAGDVAVFAELEARHSPRLRAFVRRRAECEADVDDRLQEIWFLAWLNRNSFRGDSLMGGEVAFRAWIGRVCRTVESRSALRDRRARLGVATLEAERVVELGTIDDEATEGGVKIDRLSCVIELIAELPPRQRSVVEHRCLRGLTVRETAAALCCATGTVKASLHCARQYLQAHIVAKIAQRSKPSRDARVL